MKLSYSTIPPVYTARVSKGFLPLFVQLSWVTLIIFSLAQIFFFTSLDNILSVICIATAWLILTSLFLKPKVLGEYPLSVFLIIGFAITQFYFPLIFTSLEGKPVVFNLELPLQVFLHSILALLVLTISHLIYQKIINHYFRGEPT
ncbi:MAG: hypothetical protein EOP45_17800, partial [Sphingobacteriaceae bacterium]